MNIPYSNLQVTHQNPGASQPLILPIHVVCNTSDDDIYENVRINSRRHGVWQQLIEEHNGIAVLCGSGSSLVDNIEQIKEMQNSGAKVFAMNGAANFLYENGIHSDYQVIVDAREETSELVGKAKEHLFASQVHPACFEKAPDAKVWHLQIGDIEDLFPDYPNDYCLIGGAASVGNTATCLAYAMGYRDLQIFGYDSSHRDGKSHAFHQKMNDGEPCASVVFNGKDYICSLTMKLQAEKFQETAHALKQAGCNIAVHGDGLLPDMFNSPKEILEEYEKYERMWQFDDYRKVSPGEMIADLYVSLSNLSSNDTVIDFGCGTGRGAKRIHDLTGCRVLMIDFTDNCLDSEISKDQSWYEKIKHDLCNEIPLKYKYGFCTDVMEHIKPEYVQKVIKNIMNAADEVFFQISLIDDNCGALIGHPLHLSVHTAEWWENTFKNLGFGISYRYSNEDTALFFITNTLTT